jgi:polyphenol oxidase
LIVDNEGPDHRDQLDRLDGAPADAIVASRTDVALCVVTADCAGIGLVVGSTGAVVHAGWRGLADGVVEATAAIVRAQAASNDPLLAVLGPCIHPASYAFGDDDLELLTARFGPSVRSTTTDGAPAFNLPEAVRITLQRLHATVSDALLADTADPAFFSHRVRRDRERQGLLAWRNT